MKAFFSIILAIVIGVGAVFGVSYLGLVVYRTFGTAYESARTDIYRENKSYVEGTIRDLREMKREYVTADAEHQDALRSLILHRAGDLRIRLLQMRARLREADGCQRPTTSQVPRLWQTEGEETSLHQ